MWNYSIIIAEYKQIYIITLFMTSTIHHDYVTGRRDNLYYLHSLLVMFVSTQLNFKLSTKISTIDIETIITIAIYSSVQLKRS